MSEDIAEDPKNEGLKIVFRKEAEWRNMLVHELREMETKNAIIQKELNNKTSQLEQLKDDFTHNLKLLKDREILFRRQTEDLTNCQKNLHSRDAIISELKASLDRCASELALSRKNEARIREELERQQAESIKRETDLHQKHTATLNALKQSESEDRAQLQSVLTRLQADLDAERLRSATELDEALSKASAQAEQAALDASQKQFGLQLRVQMLEQICERTVQAKKQALEDAEAKELRLKKVQSELQVALSRIESLMLSITELRTEKEIAEQKLSVAERARIGSEQRWQEEKREIMDKFEMTKAQVEWHRKELATAVGQHEEAISSCAAEKQRLLESLTKEQEETRKAISSLDEANMLRQLAERTTRTLRAECDRLRQDLEQALLAPTRVEQRVPQCEHQHLIAQLERLQTSCDRFEEENMRLKRSVAVMSEQAKQAAQNVPAAPVFAEQCVTCSRRNTPKSNHTSELERIDEVEKLNEKLRMSVKVIRQLAQEKAALKELSNRLQARLRQMEENGLNVSVPQRTLVELPMTHYSKDTAESTARIVRCSPRRKPIMSSKNVDFDERPTRDERYFKQNVVSPLPLIDPDDALSSVMGKESVAAIFQTLDRNTPMDSGSTVSERYGPKGKSKPLRAVKASGKRS